MKQTKQDVKYIIKRILIGVGIAVILFNLKKCNVYALDRYSYVFPNNSGSIQVFNTEQNIVYLPYIGNKNVINNINVVDSQIADDLTIHFGTDNANNYSTFPTILLHILYENEYDIFLQLSFNPNGTNWQKLSSGNYKILFINNPDISINGNNTDYLFPYMVPTNDIDKPLSQISDKTLMQFYWSITYTNMDSQISNNHCPFPSTSTMCNNIYNATTTDASGNTVYFGNQMITGHVYKDLFDPTKAEIIENKDNIFAYNGEILEPEPLNPISSFTEVDITGYQAILITPKSYLQLANLDGNYNYNEDTDEHSILYKYAYQRCIRQTYINITNVKDFFNVDSWINGFNENPYDSARRCATEPTLVEEPIIYTSPEMQASDTPYNYYGILLYNDSIEYSNDDENWINNQVNPYGANSVWVDTSLYNYYLVSSFSNFNQDISYIDAEGNQQTTHIDSLPTFNEMIDDSINNWDDNTYNVNTSRVESFLTFIKLPFTFLRGLRADSCSPITLPLPKLGNVTLPCIKGLVQQFLGNDVLNVVQIIINGLIIYRVTLGNISTLQNMLDPVEDKLEVLDL